MQLENASSAQFDRISKISLRFFVPEADNAARIVLEQEANIVALQDAFNLKMTEAFYSNDHYDVVSFISALEKRKDEALKEHNIKEMRAKTRNEVEQQMMQQVQQQFQQQLATEREKMRAEMQAELFAQMQGGTTPMQQGAAPMQAGATPTQQGTLPMQLG